jgi:hypothetical protein
MRIEFEESYLTADKVYFPENYDKDGFYFNKKLNGVYCVYTTVGTPSATIVTFICPYDSLWEMFKNSPQAKAEKQADRIIDEMNLEASFKNSRIEIVSTPDPTVSERFALKMLSIAMKNDKFKDL